jgi:hypothetical protein
MRLSTVLPLGTLLAALALASAAAAQDDSVAGLTRKHGQQASGRVITNDDLSNGPDRSAGNGQVFDPSAPQPKDKDDAAPPDDKSVAGNDAGQQAQAPSQASGSTQMSNGEGILTAAQSLVKERDKQIKQANDSVAQLESQLESDTDTTHAQLVRRQIDAIKQNVQQLTAERDSAQQIVDAIGKNPPPAKDDSNHQDANPTSQN